MRGHSHAPLARVLALTATALLTSVAPATPAAAVVSASSEATELRLPGGPTSAIDATPVSLDADVYLPATVPAPAVVLAHGFGGSKDSVTAEARFLQERGFVVLTYSARGFGSSSGMISMNAPAFEVADARALIDYLATRTEVTSDAEGDPRVGFAGGSYGGALALLTAGYDERVDAVAADITWNDLETSLFGQSVLSPTPAPLGVYKQLWSGLFFSSGLTTPDGSVTSCGRFTPEWCRAYTEAATTGQVSPAGAELMRRSSPASITDRITAPTLLGAGQADSLFPLAQSDATARQIASAHPDVPLKVVWHAGGHDGGVNEADRLRALTADWFSAHLDDGPPVSTDVEISLVEASALSDRARGSVEVLQGPAYPGLDGEAVVPVTAAGPPQQVLAPAGGVPAAITSLPGLGGLAALAGSLASVPLPNQAAVFVSDPLRAGQRIIGSPRVRLAVSADERASDVTLFASLQVVGPSGRRTLPNGLVSPLRLDQVGPEPTVLDVALPAVVVDVAAGDALAVVVSTTDQAYRLPAGPAVYTVALADSVVALPTVDATPVSGGLPAWAWPVGALLLAALAWLVVALLRPRTGRSDESDASDEEASIPAGATVDPVVVRGLAKEYRGGVRAVDGVDITVPPGIVLGLLGPNGAGKSTTMRMIMGLITPTAGEARVFGERVHPGAAALARIGCFVEGPGLLPHLTGRQNLDLFWRASGRGGDPHLAEVLEIAGLGPAIDRRVRTYSQGMKQRLGIAQAMLGLPDLLLLDEPTNGLDPPQIREMRQVMQDYARDGRTVIVSSHLLSEVEQTCSHVVVMHRGRVIASGTVADLLSDHAGRRLEDVFMEMVGEGHEVVTS